MRNDFDDDVSTTNDALSVVCGWSVFFYALSLSLSLSVCVCVYVYIYIEQQYAFLPFLSVRSLKGRPSNKVWRVKDMCTTKISNTSKRNSRVCVCVCLVSQSLSRFGVVVYLFRRCFLSLAFWTVFSPKSCPCNTKRRQSLVLFLARVVVVL